MKIHEENKEANFKIMKNDSLLHMYIKRINFETQAKTLNILSILDLTT